MIVFWALLIAAAVTVLKYVHAQFYPWKDCPRCTKGRQYSAGAHRDCNRCGAKGRVRRVGAGKER